MYINQNVSLLLNLSQSENILLICIWFFSHIYHVKEKGREWERCYVNNSMVKSLWILRTDTLVQFLFNIAFDYAIRCVTKFKRNKNRVYSKTGKSLPIPWHYSDFQRVYLYSTHINKQKIPSLVAIYHLSFRMHQIKKQFPLRLLLLQNCYLMELPRECFFLTTTNLVFLRTSTLLIRFFCSWYIIPANNFWRPRVSSKII